MLNGLSGSRSSVVDERESLAFTILEVERGAAGRGFQVHGQGRRTAAAQGLEQLAQAQHVGADGDGYRCRSGRLLGQYRQPALGLEVGNEGEHLAAPLHEGVDQRVDVRQVALPNGILDLRFLDIAATVKEIHDLGATVDEERRLADLFGRRRAFFIGSDTQLVAPVTVAV